MDELFGFKNIMIMGLLWKEVHTMVHIMPRIIRGGRAYGDVLFRMKYGRTGGRRTS